VDASFALTPTVLIDFFRSQQQATLGTPPSLLLGGYGTPGDHTSCAHPPFCVSYLPRLVSNGTPLPPHKQIYDMTADLVRLPSF
jgi:hypothetical protein